MIAVLGECVADAFAEPASSRAGSGGPAGELTLRVHAGGGPANTAVALARLGTPTRFLGRLSGDVFGRLFRDRLASSGVDLSACVEAAEPSTLAVASLDERGQAAYGFHAEGAADWAWTAAELASRDLGGASCLHTGSLALVREPGRDAVEAFAAAAARGATVSIDPNVRPSLAPRVAYDVTRWCAFADILRLSEDDLAFLAPDEPVERVCDLWHAAGAPLVIVTRGGAGALVSLNGERAEVAAPRVTVVDTVGAGDAFTAGLLHRLDRRGLLGGRLDGLDLATAVDAAAFAARVAALTCAVAGANPPWARDLDDRASA
ncbi:carbohydrate kinase family protein [Nonomuraea rhodomycinica]|uniref:Carbohydrate kinase n=1 Tax=Nonomuraea rhodomycinica TaxID=1712872 RepID=A0A7Y6M8F5_9ACTN|nr:carbohydrate kinase [Nonomuraea rhodomycinica]NUW39063.1 carbohydrate kinase [Nonomuraea rhodomycinica]